MNPLLRQVLENTYAWLAKVLGKKSDLSLLRKTLGDKVCIQRSDSCKGLTLFLPWPVVVPWPEEDTLAGWAKFHSDLKKALEGKLEGEASGSHSSQ